MLSDRQDWKKSELQLKLESEGWTLAANIYLRKEPYKFPDISEKASDSISARIKSMKARAEQPKKETRALMTKDEILKEYRRRYNDIILREAYDFQANKLDPERYSAIYVKNPSAEKIVLDFTHPKLHSSKIRLIG